MHTINLSFVHPFIKFNITHLFCEGESYLKEISSRSAASFDIVNSSLSLKVCKQCRSKN